MISVSAFFRFGKDGEHVVHARQRENSDNSDAPIVIVPPEGLHLRVEIVGNAAHITLCHDSFVEDNCAHILPPVIQDFVIINGAAQVVEE